MPDQGARWTPGPWFANRFGDVETVDNEAIATTVSGSKPTTEDHANARLIAAAPALYEALRITAGNIRSLGPAGALAPPFENYRPWLEMVEAALSAASVEG